MALGDPEGSSLWLGDATPASAPAASGGVTRTPVHQGAHYARSEAGDHRSDIGGVSGGAAYCAEGITMG